MKKTNHHNYIKSYILILFSITCFSLSCTKQTEVNDITPEDIPEGYVALNIEMGDIQFQEEKLADVKKPTLKINQSEKDVTHQNYSSNTGLTATVSLEAVSETVHTIKSLLKDNNKLAVLKTKTVDIGTRYRVYAYDKITGELATFKNYIRGQESSIGPLLVNGGREYTIVAYSIDSKTEYPAEIENASSITTAVINNAQVSFMFQKQDVSIASTGSKTIKIKFKHQFAQITTIVKLDNVTAGYTQIRGVGGASYFKPSYSNTKFKVSDGTITADPTDESPLGSPVAFPFIPYTDLSVKTITALHPTILNTPTAIINGTFTIETLTIGEVSRRVDIENLNLLPGVRYNLVLTFNVPKTTLIGANPYFKFYDTHTDENNPFTHTVELENPTYGAQIDIWYLDNSFNLKINGVNLFSKELNLEGFPLHHVYFSDGTYYGSQDIPSSKGRIPVVYRINEGSSTDPRKQIPIVRLTFDENGNVRLFGRKRIDENLRELFIRPEVSINPLAKLNPTGINTLTFSSTRWTITDVEGRIYGIRVQPSTP